MRLDFLSAAVAYSLFFQPVLGTPAATTKCDANNCLRAVIASAAKPGPASASADCASFFRRTVTPATITFTDTVTVPVTATLATVTSTSTLQTTTSTTTTLQTSVSKTDTFTQTATSIVSVPFVFQGPILRRQQTAVPSLIPAYASACSAVAAYSSACSCIGATPTTTTVTAPTTRVTVTVSKTGTATATIGATVTSVSTQVIITTTTATVDVSQTTTVTTTTSTTLDPAATPDTSCSNTGLEFAFYSLDNSNQNNDATYSTYDPTYIKALQPEVTGRTTQIGGFESGSEGPATIYGSTTSHLGYLTINHRGYFYVPSTGTYTFSLNQADDIALLWLGLGAKSGWTRQNARSVISYYSPGPDPQTVVLTKGEYYPLRIVYANAQGGSYLRLTVSGPDGTVITQGQDSPLLVAKSCDGIAAPEFPGSFGSET